MLALSDIIDFLLGLLRDEDARASFDQDPHTALKQAGLDGITGQDVRDAQLRLADSGVAQPVAHAASYAGGDDPVREISHTAHQFHVAPDVPDTVTGATITVDHHDTVINQTLFDSHDQITLFEDSFNQVDVTNVDAVDSFNSTVDNNVVAIQDNDTTTVDNNVVAIQDNDTITQVADPDPGSVDGPLDQGVPEPQPADPGPLDPGPLDTAPADTGPLDPDPGDATTPDPGNEPVDALPDLEPEPEPEPEPDPSHAIDHHIDAAVI